MTEYLTEQEQIELLKNWIKQYSLVILAGILMALILISGWRFWQNRQAKIYSHASSVYDEVILARAQNNDVTTSIQANKLFEHYSHTVYGEMGAFMLARSAILENNYAEAEKQLQWVIDHTSVDSFKQIARIRLARVLITQQKIKDSLAVLDDVDDKAFVGLIDEVKGDAYLANKQTDEARASYKKALAELPNSDVIRPILQMKYDNLATHEAANATN